MESLDPVYSLGATLTELALSTDPSLELDLRRLPHLKNLDAEWDQVRATISGSRHIRQLSLLNYGWHGFAELSQLPLTRLILKDHPRIEDFSGLSAFPQLTLLEVPGARHLRDISEVGACSALKELDIQRCRQIDDLVSLQGCRNLRVLNISDLGGISSMAPIKELRHLTELHAVGTVFIDGDLSPLLELPRLKLVRMRKGRYKNPTLDEVKRKIGQRD